MNDFTAGTCFVGYSVDYEFGTAVSEPATTYRHIKLLATGSTPDLPFIQDCLVVLGFSQLRGRQFDRDRRISRVHPRFGDKDRTWMDSCMGQRSTSTFPQVLPGIRFDVENRNSAMKVDGCVCEVQERGLYQFLEIWWSHQKCLRFVGAWTSVGAVGLVLGALRCRLFLCWLFLSRSSLALRFSALLRSWRSCSVVSPLLRT